MITAFIEIPKGSHNKYERDEETGAIKLDRVLYGPEQYPFEYGFVKNTRGEDGDPLDVLVLCSFPTFPGCEIEAEVLGYLEMEDEAGIDHKIIARPIAKLDSRLSHIQNLGDIPQGVLNEIKDFFETYKRLEPNKWVKVKDFKSKQEGEKIVEEARERSK